LTEVIRYHNECDVSQCNKNLQEANVLEKHALSNNLFDLKIFKAPQWLNNQEVVQKLSDYVFDGKHLSE
jgi:hypothetical protein